ncbi:DUF4185 domain-containing protein [Corynebacterium sp. UBA2622]|uniref:DUF4185 domain-containing protein n=1 Tax=Corynebacterium sp. UBA2622 TaxID=1946393 RepID=UPI0025BD8FE1|nr:DUF4185 domain-containing protein [Corynebacterium sp. UBA2622]
MHFPVRVLSVVAAGALALPLCAAPDAAAQSSFGSSSRPANPGNPGGPGDTVDNSDPSPIKKIPGTPVTMPGGVVVQIMGDLLGRGVSDSVDLRSGDLGMMTPVGDGQEFAIVFGDSFRDDTVGQGEWMSPVGVLARMNNGVIEIIRPLNAGERVNPLIPYYRAEGDNLTLIPSDVINIDGTLYMQGMWNRGIGNVSHTQIWKSTDSGATWVSVGTTGADYMRGMGNLISWERGDDGFVYVVSSGFKRNNPVYLSRFRPEQIGDRTTWEIFNPATAQWSSTGAPILAKNVKAGEMNLRRIDGQWVLVMFNEQTLSIEVRVSRDLPRNWDDVPVAVVAEHGPWSNPQTPANFSQPYGGYIVPGSTLANMDIVVSQWNTSTNQRYNATQFNVKGLDSFFGVGRGNSFAPRSATAPADPSVLEVTQNPAAVTADQAVEDSLLIQAPDNVVIPLAQ